MTTTTPADVSSQETRSARARRTVLENPLLLFALNNGIVIVLVIEFAYLTLALGGKFFRPQVLRFILLNTSMVGVLMPFYTCAQIGGIIELRGIYKNTHCHDIIFCSGFFNQGSMSPVKCTHGRNQSYCFSLTLQAEKVC